MADWNRISAPVNAADDIVSCQIQQNQKYPQNGNVLTYLVTMEIKNIQFGQRFQVFNSFNP